MKNSISAVKAEPLISKKAFLIGILVIISAISLFFYAEGQKKVKAERTKDLATINYAIGQMKLNGDNLQAAISMPIIIHEVLKQKHVTLADVNLTEEKLQQMAKDILKMYFSGQKQKLSDEQIAVLRQSHMKCIQAMNEDNFKWTDTMTWSKYAKIVDNTPERWTLLSGKEPKDLLAMMKGHYKKTELPTVVVPKIEPGQYVSLTADGACAVVLPDDPKKMSRILIKGIYYDELLNVTASKGGGGSKYLIFDTPPQGGRLKVIAYMLTDEEAKSHKM